MALTEERYTSAVAALALKDWDTYHYNNTAYAYLYKLLSRDASLEAYCTEMEHSSGNTTVSIILCIADKLCAAEETLSRKSRYRKISSRY